MNMRVPAAVFTFLAGAVVFAHASTTLTVNYGATTSSEPGITGTLTYDADTETITDPNDYTTITGDYTNDFNQGTNPGNGDNWVGLQNGDYTTYTFSDPMDYVGFNWGTPDFDNEVFLYDGATEIGSYTGSDLTDGVGYANFTPGAGEEITSITLVGPECCFETNSLSYQLAPSSPVPEPGTLPLLSSGVVAFAGIVRRKLRARAA